MNPWDRAGPSGLAKPSPRKAAIEVIDLDVEVIQLDNDHVGKRMHNDDKEDEENADDSMQDKLEHWRNYGARKLSKLGLQHEDEADFYGFAAELLSRDEECLKEFKEFVESSSKPPLNPDSELGLDLYEDIDITVAILMDELLKRPPNRKQLFDGVCIWVNGWTYPVAKTLHEFMALTGGRFRLTYTPDVTHIISTVISMPNLKIEKHQQNTVNPEWILASLREGKILPLFDYRVQKPKNDIKMMFQNQYKKNRMIGNGQNKEDREPEDIELFSEKFAKLKKTPKKTASVSGPSPAKLPRLIPPPSNFVPNPDYMPTSMDDISEDVMANLPPEIIRELEDQLKSKSTIVRHAIPSTSKSKTTKGKVNFRQQTLTFHVGPKEVNKKSVAAPQKFKQPAGGDQPKIHTVMNKQKDPAQRMVDLFSGKSDRKVGVNLCGLTDPEQITELIGEWIAVSELGDDDVAYFLRFIDCLIGHKKYEQLVDIVVNTRSFIDQRVSLGGDEGPRWNDFFFGTFKSILEDEAEFWPKVPSYLFKQ